MVVELAPERRALVCSYLAAGTVEEVAFTGALERLRIRLSAGVTEAELSRAPNSDSDALLEVTRTQHELDSLPSRASSVSQWNRSRTCRRCCSPRSCFR